MREMILIADDDPDIIEFLEDILINDNYSVLKANNGKEAVDIAKKYYPDLVILDILMPGKDGFEVCTEIRNSISSPIIFLTAKKDDIDKVRGFAVGGDDYIVKPFSISELRARIKAHLVREKRKYEKEKTYLYYGNITINLMEKTIYINNFPTPLTRKEYDIMEFLALNPGHVFSKEQIYEKLWGYDAEGDSICIAEHIKNIRQKLLSQGCSSNFITTVWGVGYKWENPQ